MSAIDPARIIALPQPSGSIRRWPHLVVLNGPGIGEVFRLIHPETIIGRGAEADVRPLHGSISRKHARVTLIGDLVMIEDLGSLNGTFVGIERVRSQRVLVEGEMVWIGNVTVLQLAFSLIAGDPGRIEGDRGASSDPAIHPENPEDFYDRLRSEHAYARRRRLPLSLVLFRIGAPADRVEGAGESISDEAFRKMAAIVSDAAPADHLVARISEREIVMVVKSDKDRAAHLAERIWKRIERARGLRPRTLAALPLTAATMAVSATQILAPETILCAGLDKLRPAIADRENCILRLPMLEFVDQEPGAPGT
jgi:two-component system cell cycle response regulator